MKIYLVFVLLFAITACSEESTKKSEPAGLFAPEHVLNKKDVQAFSSCSVEALTQQLSLKCKIVTDSILTQNDLVEAGTYTFTLSGELVTSVRLTRTVKASVACLGDNEKPTQMGAATQTTSVIYAQDSKDVSDIKSCDKTTPVWITNKVVLESGQVLEDVTVQLVM